MPQNDANRSKIRDALTALTSRANADAFVTGVSRPPEARLMIIEN